VPLRRVDDAPRIAFGSRAGADGLRLRANGGLVTPIRHGPAGLPAQAAPRVLPDATSCAHRLVELFGVAQCSRCDRYFAEVKLEDGSIGLQVELPRYPPGPTE